MPQIPIPFYLFIYVLSFHKPVHSNIPQIERDREGLHRLLKKESMIYMCFCGCIGHVYLFIW